MAEQPRILVIRRRYLGDIVLLGSFLRNLHLHWPEAVITVLVDPAYAPVLALNPDVAAVLSPPDSLSGWPRFATRLRKEGFSHVINFDNTERTALISRLTGAPFRLGLHHSTYPVKLRSFYTQVLNDPHAEHESRPITGYYLKALSAMDIPVRSTEVRLIPRENDLADLKRFVGASGKVLLVHPGSRSAWRLWPIARFAEVCDLVQDELGVQVVLTGGPGETNLVSEIRSQARTHLVVPPMPMSLPRLAALARLSSVVLCHDSGPMHVAAAVGTPVVALYGSQNPVLFRPEGPGHTLLCPSMPCTACVSPDRCTPADSYHTLCVRRLSVEDVYAAVRNRLEAVQKINISPLKDDFL